MTTNEFTPFHTCLPIGDFETPIGFASRIAYANAFGPLSLFCAALKFNATKIRLGESETIRRLAGHAQVDANTLGRFAFRSSPVGHRALFGAELVERTMIRRDAMRFCPHCVFTSIESSHERPAAAASMQAQWHLDFASCCELHEVKLSTADAQGGHDFGQYVDLHLPDIAHARRSSPIEKPTTAAKYFTARVLGTQRRVSALDTFSFTEAFEVVDALGRLETGMEKPAKETSEAERQTALQAGFEIADQGEDSIIRYFDARVERVRRDRRFVYGDLVRVLKSHGDLSNLGGLRDRVRQHGIANLGLSSRAKFLGPVTERLSQSVAMAAGEHGVPRKKVFSELVKRGVIGPDTADKNPTDIVVPIGIISEIMSELSIRVDVETAAGILGVTRLQVHQLADEGLFRRLEHRRFAAPTMIRRYQLIELLDRVRANLTVFLSTESLHHIELAAAVTACPASQIISLVADGKLPAMRETSGCERLLSLKVDPEQVVQAVKSWGKPHAFDSEIIANPTFTVPLLASGHLRLPIQLGTKTLTRTSFDPLAFSELRFTIIPLYAIARAMQITHEGARAKLAEAKIKPAVEIIREGFRESSPLRCYYLIREIEPLV
jgi:hypothetical protein